MLFAHYNVSILPHVCILAIVMAIGLQLLRGNISSIWGWCLTVIPAILLVALISWYSRMQKMWYDNFFNSMRRRQENEDEHVSK